MPSRKSTTQPDDSTEVMDVPEELAAMFDRHLGPLVDPRRPGEFSAGEFARIRKMSDGRACAVLNKFLSDGTVTRRSAGSNKFWWRFVE